MKNKMDFVEQIVDQISERIAATALVKFETRINEFAKQQFKPFYTFTEMTVLFDCSITTVRRRAKEGVLAYTRNFNGEQGCTPDQIKDYFKRLEVRAGAVKE